MINLDPDEIQSSSSNSSLANSTNTSPTLMPPDTTKKVKWNKDTCTKHPIYRGVCMRNWGKWVLEIREPRKKSHIWLVTFPTLEMAARAHDVAALSIKGNSAILNFPKLTGSLPRTVSQSPRDVKAAAAAMDKFDLPSPTSSLSNNTSSSSPLSSLISAIDLSATGSDSEELSEIVELPSLGNGFGSVGLKKKITCLECAGYRRVFCPVSCHISIDRVNNRLIGLIR